MENKLEDYTKEDIEIMYNEYISEVNEEIRNYTDR